MPPRGPKIEAAGFANSDRLPWAAGGGNQQIETPPTLGMRRLSFSLCRNAEGGGSGLSSRDHPPTPTLGEAVRVAFTALKPI